MRIDDVKRRIRGERDALSRRRQRDRASRRAVQPDRRCQRGDGVEVKVPFGEIRKPSETVPQVVMLGGLLVSKTSVWQADGVVARQRAHDRYAELGDRIGHEQAMAIAADAVE